MTTQAHPPTEAQQLADARTATRAAEQKAAHWQAVADRQRRQIEMLETEIDRWRAENNRLGNDVAQLEHERDTADTYASEMTWHRKAAERERDELSRELAELTRQIAAEKAAHQEQIAGLRAQIDPLGGLPAPGYTEAS